MYLHRMTVEQLSKAVSEATILAEEVFSTQPELAHILLDAVELACKEILVHSSAHGDRELADRIYRQINRNSDSDA